jgi:hypothetical protein
MARNLAATNSGAKEIPAHEDGRCLACHTNPLTAGPGRAGPHKEGVGCEACHGAAKGEKPWLEVHATTRWRELSAKEKAGYGMTPLEDPVAQARTCAGCHVGAPDGRDLNHDLIAAGHPRLDFELANYRANMPPHWRSDKYDQREPGYEARLWAVGQVESARASLKLLVSRAEAEAAPVSKPWPEFAEYSCFACHSGLRATNWQRAANLGRRKPGSLPYSVWYTSLLPVLATRGDALPDTFSELGLAMSEPSPDRKKVTDLAGKGGVQLDGLLAKVQQDRYDRAAVKALLGHLAAHGERAPATTWDEKEQFALAVAALSRADRALARAEGGKPLLGPEADKHLRGLFEALAFPPGSEGPVGFRDNNRADEPMKKVLEDLRSAGGRPVAPAP